MAKRGWRLISEELWGKGGAQCPLGSGGGGRPMVVRNGVCEDLGCDGFEV